MLSICCNSCVKSLGSKTKIREEKQKLKPFINKFKWEGINHP